jgi:hypothetical protein
MLPVEPQHQMRCWLAEQDQGVSRG